MKNLNRFNNFLSENKWEDKSIKKLGDDFSMEVPFGAAGIESPDDSKDNDEEERLTNYMFFSNLKNIMSMCKEILDMNDEEVDTKLTQGHAWAVDHVATSADDINEVYSFLKGDEDEDEEEHGFSNKNDNFLECED